MRNKYDKIVSREVNNFLSEIKSQIEQKINNVYENYEKYESKDIKHSAIIETSVLNYILKNSMKDLKLYKKELKRMGYKVEITYESWENIRYSTLIIVIEW